MLGDLVQRSGFSPEAALEMHKQLYRGKLNTVSGVCACVTCLVSVVGVYLQRPVLHGAVCRRQSEMHQQLHGLRQWMAACHSRPPWQTLTTFTAKLTAGGQEAAD